MENIVGLRQTVGQFFSRTTASFIAAVGLVFAYFFLEFTPILIKALNKQSGIDKNYLNDSTSSYIVEFLGKLSLLPFARTLITALIWGFIGLALYTAYFFIRNMLIDTRNHIESAAEDSHEVSRQEVIKAARLNVAKIVGYIVFLMVSLLLLFGVWVDLIQVYILSAMSASKLPFIIGGIAGFIINVYLLLAIAYLIWKREQSRYNLSITWKM